MTEEHDCTFRRILADRLNRSVKVEQALLRAASPDEPPPTKQQLRDWALYLGTPSGEAGQLKRLEDLEGILTLSRSDPTQLWFDNLAGA